MTDDSRENQSDIRALIGRYEIDDPRPIAKEAPYTFFLPERAELEALRPGDLVRLTFRSVPTSAQWDAERMWVRVSKIEAEGMTGTLENDPCDMPQLKLGAEVFFEPYHVLAIRFEKIENRQIPACIAREYWERCLVDDCVLYEGVPVSFLYREEPDMTAEGDEFPDSGWRIRGDYRGLSDEEIDARKLSYVALGAVLNRDDSWLHLIAAPVGSAFHRDFATGKYAPEER